MALREAKAGRKGVQAPLKAGLPGILEGKEPLPVCLGVLYAYDMTLTLEANVKSPADILSGFRKLLEGRFPDEGDRKAALEVTESELRKLAAGKDESQSSAARKLLECWGKAH